MRKHLSTILLVFILILGMAIMLYPTFSDYWNSLHQSRAIASYSEALHNVSAEDFTRELDAASEYNTSLIFAENRYLPTPEQTEEYHSLLNITGSGIMGYIEIPKISVSLPIYHSTDEAVLQIAVGHIEGTSLPTGGRGTHCVLSGHRGLPSAKLFTDLDRMEAGDTFVLRVLDQILTYEVDQILIVEPYDLSALSIDPYEDYCTLVTCTPYGINTHRMLVRGHRVENQREAKLVTVVAEATQIDTTLVAVFMGIPMLLVVLIWIFVSSGRQNREARARRRVKRALPGYMTPKKKDEKKQGTKSQNKQSGEKQNKEKKTGEIKKSTEENTVNETNDAKTERE
ncbi:MAG: class C sortase [Clostridia bacterium]|nr:class C sortase [Clostridia bacterium]